MSKGEGSKVFRTEGAPIPGMQKVQTGGTEKKGAPIPNMQAVPNSKPQSGGGQSQAGGSQTGGSGSGQSNTGKQK